jgi:hypothetical protein
MKRILFSFVVSILCISLIACQKPASQEVIQYETEGNIYTHFISDPQTGKENFIKNYGLGIDELLQGMLLSQEKPSEATLSAFSQLFSEAYRNAIDTNLTPSENTVHAEILGKILGGLMGLRKQVLAKREARFLAGWYDYTELDQRWLALFTDVVLLDQFYGLSGGMIEIARNGAVNEFAETLMQRRGYGKQVQDYDLIEELIYEVSETAVARFNGYRQETGHSVVGSAFDIKLVMAWNDMKHQINKRNN